MMTDSERRRDERAAERRRDKQANLAAARDFRERMRAAWQDVECPITFDDAPIRDVTP